MEFLARPAILTRFIDVYLFLSTVQVGTGKESCRVLARGCAVDGFRYKRVPGWMAPRSRNTSPYLLGFTRTFNLTLIPLAAPETGADTATLFQFFYPFQRIILLTKSSSSALTEPQR